MDVIGPADSAFKSPKREQFLCTYLQRSAR